MKKYFVVSYTLVWILFIRLDCYDQGVGGKRSWFSCINWLLQFKYSAKEQNRLEEDMIVSQTNLVKPLCHCFENWSYFSQIGVEHDSGLQRAQTCS